jgi:hypothetical protein
MRIEELSRTFQSVENIIRITGTTRLFGDVLANYLMQIFTFRIDTFRTSSTSSANPSIIIGTNIER